MASFITNIRTKNYQHLVISLQVTVEKVGDAFSGHSVIGAYGPLKSFFLVTFYR